MEKLCPWNEHWLHSNENGWIVYDDNHPRNNGPELRVVISCNTWEEITVARDEPKPPRYIPYNMYLTRLDDLAREREIKNLEIFHKSYASRKSEMFSRAQESVRKEREESTRQQELNWEQLLLHDRQGITTSVSELSKELDTQPDTPVGTSNPGGFVTNATSRSVAFYVICFLNNQGYTPEEIMSLREKLDLERRMGMFYIEEIQQCMIKQSVYFLELFTKQFLTQFASFLQELEVSGRFSSVFRKYKDANDVLSRFERRIYHSNYHCEWMRKDYEDESICLPNSGVFANSVVVRNEYFITQDYLDQLGMRVCSVCQGGPSPG